MQMMLDRIDWDAGESDGNIVDGERGLLSGH
jgi:hypothetical protein